MLRFIGKYAIAISVMVILASFIAPIEGLRTYGVIALGVAIAMVVIDRPNPARELAGWPNARVLDAGVVLAIAVAVPAFGIWAMSGPVTCGGQTMGAGDRCVSYRSGAVRTAGSMQDAPLRQPVVWIVIGLIIAIVAASMLLRRRQPTAAELQSYRAKVAEQRRLLAVGYLDPPETTPAQARFDQQVEAELARARKWRPAKE